MVARNRQLVREEGICLEGRWGSEFHQIIPAGNDLVLTKHAYSAFIGTDLQERLLAKDIQTLMVTGVLTNVCCESTLAMVYARFYTYLVEDCCASTDQAAHLAAVENVESISAGSLDRRLYSFLQRMRG
jgi:ureidoacrylate peracid hydrolase